MGSSTKINWYNYYTFGYLVREIKVLVQSMSTAIDIVFHK